MLPFACHSPEEIQGPTTPPHHSPTSPVHGAGGSPQGTTRKMPPGQRGLGPAGPMGWRHRHGLTPIMHATAPLLPRRKAPYPEVWRPGPVESGPARSSARGAPAPAMADVEPLLPKPHRYYGSASGTRLSPVRQRERGGASAGGPAPFAVPYGRGRGERRTATEAGGGASCL